MSSSTRSEWSGRCPRLGRQGARNDQEPRIQIDLVVCNHPLEGDAVPVESIASIVPKLRPPGRVGEESGFHAAGDRLAYHVTGEQPREPEEGEESGDHLAGLDSRLGGITFSQPEQLDDLPGATVPKTLRCTVVSSSIRRWWIRARFFSSSVV